MFRVMIVDDETIFRKGLINFLEWNKMDCEVVCECSNGIEAKNILLDMSPDIIIADIKMPGLNGIDLTEYIYNNHPNIKIIILSAYADFIYAQSAIKFGVVEFVIKSMPLENIQNAIKKAIKLLVYQRESEKKLQSLEGKIKNNISIISEKLFYDIANCNFSDKELIQNELNDLDIKLDDYYVAAFEIDDKENDFELVNSHEKSGRFGVPFKNLLSLAFKDFQNYVVFLNQHLACVLISFSDQDSLEHMQRTISICQEVLNTVESFMGFSVSIGISDIHNGIDKIDLAFSEARKAALCRFYIGGSISIYSKEACTASSLSEDCINQYLDKIVDLVQNGDTESALNTVNAFFETQRVDMRSLEYVKLTGILLSSLCSKLLSIYNISISDILHNSADIYKQIFLSKSINNIYALITDIIREVSNYFGSGEKQSNFIINNIKCYIRENYSKQITLQVIANYVHMNSSYLSRLFKKKTGDTITDTINKLRIEKAKELLVKSSIKSYEIASMVGINDSAYFSFVFKKHTGLSPKEYKETNYLDK